MLWVLLSPLKQAFSHEKRTTVFTLRLAVRRLKLSEVQKQPVDVHGSDIHTHLSPWQLFFNGYQISPLVSVVLSYRAAVKKGPSAECSYVVSRLHSYIPLGSGHLRQEELQHAALCA